MNAVSPSRHSFLLKLAGALLLVALADLLFWFQRAGSTIGLFALALLVLAACMRIEMFARWPSRLALAAAFAFSLALAADPGPLALALYWTALTLAVLLPRTARFDDGWRWAKRLLLHGVLSPIGPWLDARRARRARRRRGPTGIGRGLRVLILPALGSALFLILFAQANPLIGDFLARLDFRPAFDALTVVRAIFWAVLFTALWSLLRPPQVSLRPAGPGLDPDFALPGVSLASIALSLAAFNLIFAVQNGLDLAFLWSGAPLPAGLTLAEYAHRGAYPLIATALLAGLFVLVTLRPGSASAGSRAIRLLVTLWIGQNLLLVGSTMLRTFDYVEAYSLTRLRIAALIWMALVAIGLALICYRLLRGKSGAWLINANLLAAALTLGACCTVDLGRMAAAWNVRHAREVGGSGAALDLCYLNQLGPSALLPLIELESRPLPAGLRARVVWVRSRILDDLAAAQGDWHGWTLRNHGRLAAANAAISARRLGTDLSGDHGCDGNPILPAKPLTAPAAR
ncbi:MAG TPA: DUF4173 domain-containing protein [Allosphingosinicella sp.]|nr:DUF4173 domain-containing protein [Allosphingosinicella sp.]